MYKSSLNKTKAWSGTATGPLELSANSTGYKYTGAWKDRDYWTQEWLTSGRNKIYMNAQDGADKYRFLSSASCDNSDSRVVVDGGSSNLCIYDYRSSNAVVPCVLF